MTDSKETTAKRKLVRQTHCFAPGCKSGQARRRRDPDDGRRPSMFGVPKDEQLFERWKRYMPPRPDGKQLTRQSAVCELHFDPQFVQRHFEHIINKELVRIERGKPALTSDAVPTIFPDSPKYYTRRVPKRRKLPERSAPPPKVPRKRNKRPTDEEPSPLGDAEPQVDDAPDPGEPQPPPPVADAADVTVIEREVTPVFPYEDLPLPSPCWARHVIQERPKVVAYSVCSVSPDSPGHLETEKLVLVTEKECYAECRVYLRGRRLYSLEGVGGTDYPWTLLERVHALKHCPGFAGLGEIPEAEKLPYVVKERGCLHSMLCNGVGSPRGRMCFKCSNVRALLRKNQVRREQRRERRLLRMASAAAVVAPDAVERPESSGSNQSTGGVSSENSGEGCVPEVVLTEGDPLEGSLGQVVEVLAEGVDECHGDVFLAQDVEVIAEDDGVAAETEVVAGEDDEVVAAEEEVPYETVVANHLPIYVI